MTPSFKSVPFIAILSCSPLTLSSQDKTPKVSVPFVGCKADGQAGPIEGPKDTNKLVSIPAESAQKLAYYKAEQGFGVLAPRGWYCFETYGSNGGSLYVSPQPIDSQMLFSDKREGFTGPIVQLSGAVADTSGRFEVAQTIARVFPAYMNFTRKVIAEGFGQKGDFPQGPYPKDKLTYKNKSTVIYQTPANTKGLGTDSWLEANASPIDGVATLTFYGERKSKIEARILLAARLPSDEANLTPAIIQQVEQEASQAK